MFTKNTKVKRIIALVLSICILSSIGYLPVSAADEVVAASPAFDMDAEIAEYLVEHETATIIYLYPVGVDEDGSIILDIDREATLNGTRSARNLVTIGLYMRPAGTRTYRPEVTYFGYNGTLTYISITLDFGDGTYQNQYASPPSGNYGWNLYYNNKTYASAGTYYLSIFYGRIEVNDQVYSTTNEMQLNLDTLTVS